MSANLLLPQHVTSKLKCDLCRGYLSVPPISTYEEKFSCGRCNPGWPRNVVYEELAQFMMFPCTYCEERMPWGEVANHETQCRRNVILCPTSYEKNYKIGKMPTSNFGEYHKECQHRRISCPFDMCATKYEVKNILPHFGKFHKDYVFANNIVAARKILKEEKVWNFRDDNQVCLLLFKQMPFLLFVHGDCDYHEPTGDIISYNYYFSVFSLCLNQCDIRYVVALTLDSVSESSTFTMKNQEIKPFNEKLHRVNFMRNGLVKYNSFNFMTTRFEELKKSADLKLTYTVKLLDNFEPSADKYPKEKLFVNADGIGKNFECPICKEYMCAPIFNCDLGHSLCKSCKQKMAICPFCKAYIGNSRNFVLEDIVETLHIPCQNEPKGCAVTGRVQEMKMHELMCLYK